MQDEQDGHLQGLDELPEQRRIDWQALQQRRVVELAAVTGEDPQEALLEVVELALFDKPKHTKWIMAAKRAVLSFFILAAKRPMKSGLSGKG